MTGAWIMKVRPLPCQGPLLWFIIPLKELQMRFLVALLTVVSIAIVVNAQTPGRSAAPARGQAAAPARPPKPVTTALFFDKEKVAPTFAKGCTLVKAPDMIVRGSHRDV